MPSVDYLSIYIQMLFQSTDVSGIIKSLLKYIKKFPAAGNKTSTSSLTLFVTRCGE